MTCTNFTLVIVFVWLKKCSAMLPHNENVWGTPLKFRRVTRWC